MNWPKMMQIAASWVISPILGGVIAALFLWFIKLRITNKDDKIAAARRWVPVLIAIMAGAFSAYLAVKGLKKIINIDLEIALLIGLGFLAATYFITRPLIHRQSNDMQNTKGSVRKLFTIPLVCAAALLSFAHGANDVANAVGPLAAIVHTTEARRSCWQGINSNLGYDCRCFWYFIWLDAVWTKADPNGRRTNYQVESHARLLRCFVCSHHSDYCILAWPACEFYPLLQLALYLVSDFFARFTGGPRPGKVRFRP